MMSLLRITIFVSFAVVTSHQNLDVNSQIPYGGRPKQRDVEAKTSIPPDPKINNEGLELLLTRLEFLFVEKMEYLITDTNRRFQSLENQLSQCSSCPTSPVVQNIKNLETNVENLGKNIQELMEATRNLSSDVAAIKGNNSSVLNVTRSLEALSCNSELKQISNEGLELKNSTTATSTSSSLNLTLDNQYPRNCREVGEFEKTASGNYMIQPEHAPKPFEVVCDLETRGGGWTVIQRRFDGSQDFYLGWEDYKKGFGDLGGEFWLGLEKIHILTGFEVYELLIEIGNFESQNKSAFYSEFSIGSEIEEYSLKALGNYSGDAGDSLTYHAGSKFSTKDKDQDSNPSTHCAQYSGGAWWYNSCTYSNLNGMYFGRGQVPEKIHSNHIIFWYVSMRISILQHTRMLVRPKL